MLDLSEGKIKTAIRRFRAALKPSMEANDRVVASASLNLARAYPGDRDAAILCLRRLVENPATDLETKVDALVELGALHAAAFLKSHTRFPQELDGREERSAGRNASVLMRIGESILRFI